MGSTTPSKTQFKNERTDECCRRANEGISRKKFASNFRSQSRKEAATNFDRVGVKRAHSSLWKQPLIAAPSTGFYGGLEFCKCSSSAWPLYRIGARLSAFRLQPARDPVLLLRLELPASFEPPRTPALPATLQFFHGIHPSALRRSIYRRAAVAAEGLVGSAGRTARNSLLRGIGVSRARAPAGRADVR